MTVWSLNCSLSFLFIWSTRSLTWILYEIKYTLYNIKQLIFNVITTILGHNRIHGYCLLFGGSTLNYLDDTVPDIRTRFTGILSVRGASFSSVPLRERRIGNVTHLPSFMQRGTLDLSLGYGCHNVTLQVSLKSDLWTSPESRYHRGLLSYSFRVSKVLLHRRCGSVTSGNPRPQTFHWV